jgi:hypothetical protein
MHRIFQEDPRVFARLFRTCEITFPEPVEAVVLSPDVTEIKPAERYIDTLIRFDTAENGSYLLAVEAQCRKDRDKPGAWAYYTSYLQEKYRMPVVLLVVCQDEATANWARGPLRLGFPQWPTLTVRPVVAGPDNVPLFEDIEQAAQDISLAALAVITHAWDPKVYDALETLLAAFKTIDEDKLRFFTELTELGLGDAPAARIWSSMMSVDTSFYRSHTSQVLRAEGLAEGVLGMLVHRGVDVPGEVRARIQACEDRDLLMTWLFRASKVERAEDIFRD